MAHNFSKLKYRSRCLVIKTQCSHHLCSANDCYNNFVNCLLTSISFLDISEMFKDKTNGKSINIEESASQSPNDFTSSKSSDERTIEISIDTIENLVVKECSQIMTRIQHNGRTLGESIPIEINVDYSGSTIINVHYTLPFKISIDNWSCIDSAVSSPILITVLKSRGRNSSRNEFPTTASGKGKIRNKKESSREQRSDIIKDGVSSVIGICNFDIMPLFLGEKKIADNLLLETPFSGIAVACENLARLTVSAILLETEIFPSDLNVNFLTITLETIHNLISDFKDDMTYRGSTVIYRKDDVADEIIFEAGRMTNVPDIEKRKQWQTLSTLESRARLTQYKLNSDFTKTDPNTEFIIQENPLNNEPRIQWNSMRRSALLQSGCEVMSTIIQKYKYWPFFFTAIPKSSNTNKTKTRKSDSPLIFQCYVDISDLLYPGVTRTRTVAQLHTYNLQIMTEKTGLEKCVFDRAIPKSPTKLKRGKSVSNKQSLVPLLTSISTESEYVANVATTSEKIQPLLVVIEFELHSALNPAQSLNDLTNRLDELITSKYVTCKPITIDSAEEQYSNCIEKLIDLMSMEYQSFIECGSNTSSNNQTHCKIVSSTPNLVDSSCIPDCTEELRNNDFQSDSKKEKYDHIEDDVGRFIQQLHDKGVYVGMRTALKNKITILLDEKFKVEMHSANSKDLQDFIATVYIYLTEQMHVTLNNYKQSRSTSRSFKTKFTENFSIYGEESYMLGNIHEARIYYLNALKFNTKNADAWIEYTVYLLRIRDVDRAMECCREALVLDKLHKIGLILYGLILSEKNHYPDAEIFFQSVTRVYPRCAESWTVLYLFSLRTELFSGADVWIDIAQKCIDDEEPDHLTTQFLNRDPMPWTTFNSPKNRIFIVTAILLMKLYCLDFAGSALAQELSLMGRTKHVLYYMSVQHYLESKYEDALLYLKEAADVYGMDYSIASLKGHCYKAIGDSGNAICFYEFANSLFERPQDLHLVQLNLGNLYLDNEQYEKAKKLFLIACKNSPTCRTWLGAGMAFYHLNDMKNSETTLIEANRLDSQNADVWGYLCLLHMSLSRYNEFVHCYRQMVKNNLKTVQIWTLITEMMKSLDYAMPLISLESDENLT